MAMIHKFRKRLVCVHNNKGSAILTVMAFIMITVVLVASMLALAQMNLSNSINASQRSSAFYVAESALEDSISTVEKIFVTNQYKTTNLVNQFNESDGDLLVGRNITYAQKIMGKDSSSTSLLTFVNTLEDGKEVYLLSTTANVGDSSRALSKQLVITNSEIIQGQQGEFYQPDAVLALDLDGTLAPITFKSENTQGPFVTNQEIIFNNQDHVYSGPLVTNNKIVVEAALSDFSNARIITSSTIKFKSNNTHKVHSIIIKPGGIIDIPIPNYGTFNIQYILLPLSSKGKELQHFYGNGVANTYAKNFWLTKTGTNVIYYDPLDFDPWKTVNVDYLSIFGNNPDVDSTVGFDYRDYFKESFYLDNLDNLTYPILPKVKLPQKPTYSTANLVLPEVFTDVGWGNPITYVDSNNNLKVTASEWYRGLKILDWSHFENNTRSFNSINITSSESGDHPYQLFIGDQDVTIVTKKLILKNFIQVVGTGKLKIHVIGSSNLVTASDFSVVLNGFSVRDDYSSPVVHDPSRVQLIVHETTNGKGGGLEFKVNNHSNYQVGLSVFSENLNLYNALSFTGHFITANGTSIFQENSGSSVSSQLIYAPNAVANFKGGTFKGVLVAKTIEFANAGINFSYSSDIEKSFLEEILPDYLEKSNTGTGSGNSGPGSGTVIPGMINQGATIEP